MNQYRGICTKKRISYISCNPTVCESSQLSTFSIQKHATHTKSLNGYMSFSNIGTVISRSGCSESGIELTMPIIVSRTKMGEYIVETYHYSVQPENCARALINPASRKSQAYIPLLGRVSEVAFKA